MGARCYQLPSREFVWCASRLRHAATARAVRISDNASQYRLPGVLQASRNCHMDAACVSVYDLRDQIVLACAYCSSILFTVQTMFYNVLFNAFRQLVLDRSALPHALAQVGC